jgi:hypothetical protein
MKLAPPVDCPDVLLEPFASYTNAVLQEFIRRTAAIKMPSNKNKASLVHAVRCHYFNINNQ